jgi:hypothetical protein
MTDQTAAIEALLLDAERAHGVYEATELNGVYDEDWPRWYAAYAVEHGLAELVGRPVEVDRLAQALARGFEAFKATDPEPTERWSSYLARRLADEF